MSTNKRAAIVLRLLNKFYPRVSVPLKHRNLFTLLVSVALSAQTTDVNVNKATRKIPILRAGNMSLGINLLMYLTEIASKSL